MVQRHYAGYNRAIIAALKRLTIYLIQVSYPFSG